MSDRERCKTLFLEAVENHPPEKWTEFLDQNCSQDSSLRESVQSLLDTHQNSNVSLDESLELVQARANVPQDAEDDQDFGHLLVSQIGQFRIQRIVGRGGMGNVFLAHDASLNRLVALKLPRIDVLGNPELQDRFLKEAKVAASLRHPGLVEIYEFGTTGRFCYLASRWCPNGDLASWLDSHPQPHDPFQVAAFIQQLCIAVAHCHDAGVLHLDIKPGNIMLECDDGSSEDPSSLGLPLLTDFGLARVMEQSLSDAQSSTILGTPLYMAPEQVECRREDIGPQTDVFAIGVVLFEMLYGHRPFEGKTPMEVFDRIRSGEIVLNRPHPSIPSDLRSICQVCLQPRIADRYGSPQQLADDLGRVLNDEPMEARSPSLPQRLSYWLTDPERLRQAGATMVSIQLAGTAGVFLLIALLFLGFAGPFTANPWALLFQYLPLFFFLNIPSVYVGLQSIRQRPWAIITGLALSTAYVVTASLMSAGKMTPLVVYDGLPAASFIGNYIHAAFASIQFLVFALAIPAAIRLWSVRRETVS